MKNGIIYILLSCLGFQFVTAQTIPMDPKVRVGKLDNGLSYYIRDNKEPKERAEFFIVQNVGSILENDNQNGLAHFLEHIAFNGTKNFPGKGIINYFETIGVKFGANINAYTSLDETVYHLSAVPTIREGIIDSALLVLHDWSNFISLEDKEIDAERGVIMEEWRQGATADRRMWKASNILKYPGSQYAKRDVIGDTAVIQHFEYQMLRDYYKKWYRPDLQAIIIVGDLDPAIVEAKIKNLFADISKKSNAGERPIYSLPNNSEPIVAIVTDPEARMTRIEIAYKHDVQNAVQRTSIQGYALDLAKGLISSMIDNRFEEITQQANAAFVGAQAEYGQLVKSKDAFQLIVIPKESKELEGLNALLVEIEKIKRFGFTNSELERVKVNSLKAMEKAFNEKDNQKSGNLVREYIGNFLNQEPIPGIEWEYESYKMLLPQLDLERINQLAKSFVLDSNIVISITAPEKATVKIPTKEQILLALNATQKIELSAPLNENNSKKLLDKLPKAGKIKQISLNNSLGTTEWKLSNGIKVIFKPTTFKKDEILMSAFSPGGLSKVSKIQDLPSAILAPTIVSNNGISKFNQIELNKLLTGKIATLTPFIDGYGEGLNGTASVKDLETLLQLIHLEFTAIRQDDNAFTALINTYKTVLANSDSNPLQAFSDSINLVLNNHHPRTILMKLGTLDQVSQKKAIAIFKKRFSNPADFTFMFCGNIDPSNDSIKHLIMTYLAGLKTNKSIEKFKDNQIRSPKGILRNEFTKEMKVKKASNMVYLSADLAYNMNNITLLNALASILNIRYLESIREKEGGSYGVQVSGQLSKVPVEKVSLSIQFDTDPAKQRKLMDIISAEITEIIANGPLEKDLQKVKENLLKKYNEDLKQNKWWSSTMTNYYKNNLNYVDDYKASVENLTPSTIQAVLKTILDQGNKVEIVMQPKP